jgi:D-alanyl-D-alanine-carboxypeptidase/D-alanyl-D-alanine-endopeptidase
MKKYFLFVCLATSFSCKSQSGINKLVDSLANAYLQNHAGALTVGINDNGNTRYFYFGETRKGNHQLPDSNSIFDIGSITETFTSILFADLVTSGIIHIDDPLQKYLPVEVVSPVYQQLVCKLSDIKSEPVPSTNKQDAALRMGFTPVICLPDPSSKPQPILLWYLSTHTSGFPEYPDNLNQKIKSENPFGTYTESEMFDFLNNYKLEKPIGFDYRHSDFGIALLGEAISLKMKRSYDSLLTERILKKLNMTDTRIYLSAEQQKHYLAGYNEKDNVVQHWTYNVMAPAGALHSSTYDMMKFLSENISKNKTSIVNLLDYTHNPRIRLQDNSSQESEIALGWKVNPLGIESKKIVWQSSRRGGFASYIGFNETSHTGVVILSSLSKDVNEMGKLILMSLEKEGM